MFKCKIHSLGSLMLAGALLMLQNATAQTVNVGSGSYTTQFPGTDAAGRNGFPSGQPLVVGQAAGKPAPTNDWWSHKIKNAHSDNLFNYPFTLKTVPQGLVHSFIPWGVIDNILPVVVGVSGLNATEARVSNFTDWTVSMRWANASHAFTATAGVGMPFTYFEKNSSDVAEITVNEGQVTINNHRLLIENARNGADFIIYAPTGSVWSQSGNKYTSTLSGKNYWSLFFVPPSLSTNMATTAAAYEQYAYVFPTNTTVNWSFDEASSVVTTVFNVAVDVKEGSHQNLLQGLLPHQWAHLSSSSPQPTAVEIPHVRGSIKLLSGNTFTVENTFYGILPTLPSSSIYSAGYSPSAMNEKTALLRNDQLATWTDSYNEGQVMNRLIQTARIAHLTGDTATLNAQVATVKERLEDWLSHQSGEVAFLFYYHSAWSALLGYPAGHGQDNNINDHHFHWGYFIHAAAFMEQFEPGWAAQWGPMINLLVRDAASPNRNDPMFPFLRNFSPYAGHCWANGFASFPQGNDQESTSESMQFNSSLIHWGSITQNDSIRDLGIYLYTTEQSAIDEYWFDKQERIFQANQQYGLVSRVWGNSYDNGTFWTADIAASYGIELYPIHGGSFYLGHDTAYVRKIWNEMTQYTGILSNQVNDNLWHDEYWKYLALIDPQAAINLYDSYPERNLKFGITDAQTYHWLHALNVLGVVDVSVTANHPLAMVFNKNGNKHYVAHNYSNSPINVQFSDGYSMQVPANRLKSSLDLDINGSLQSDFTSAYAGGSVNLQVQVNGGTPDKVSFYQDETWIGDVTTAPYTLKAENLSVGKHRFFARIYDGSLFSLTNLVTVEIGEQLPYSGNPTALPGTIEAAHYDVYEGGSGQGIAYNDLSPGNNGDFRPTESVDAIVFGAEGATVGWIAAGEWLEYTVEVQQAGLYNVEVRYACGNNAGGGPMHILFDGEMVKPNNTFTYTGNWNTWSTKTITAVALKSGTNVLRLHFENGEINVGKLTFTYDAPLPYSQPIANAGSNVLVQLPNQTTSLDASASVDPNNGALSFMWKQQYGPTVATVSNATVANPSIGNLEEGVYLFELEVSNGNYTDRDEVYIISSTTNDFAPKVAITAPLNQSKFIAQDSIQIQALANDLIGNVRYVDFYIDSNWWGRDSISPYVFSWFGYVGSYQLSAKATDDGGLTATSNTVQIEVTQPPLCRDTALSGHFAYQFSSGSGNPTLTFIPLANGMGSPTCILYYGTNASALPGYGVTPNVPFTLNAQPGERIFFYYTYSHPAGGERNNSADKLNYVIGTCVDTLINSPMPPPPPPPGGNTGVEAMGHESTSAVTLFPNPTDGKVNLVVDEFPAQIQVFDQTGKWIFNQTAQTAIEQLDWSALPAGIYFVQIRSENQQQTLKLVKW